MTKKTNHIRPQKRSFRRHLAGALFLFVAVFVGTNFGTVQALLPAPGPQSGSVGLEGTISAPAPTRAATITTPTSGRTFAATPVTVNGLCPEGVMVKLFSNNIFVGSVKCTNGSYNLQVDLFSGANELIARVFDDLDQAGPDSNTVNVTFNDPQFSTFSGKVMLTSNYAKIGANPGERLSWPIVLSGGTGPYALTVDWGDGKPETLKSLTFSGNILIDHVYDTAGIYRIVVKATDSQGSTGYLQLVGVANGSVGATSNKTSDISNSSVTVTKTKVSPLPAVIAVPLILASFWLGRNYELQSLRRRIEASTASEYTR